MNTNHVFKDVLFPEYEIISEPEDENSSSSEDDDDSDDDDRTDHNNSIADVKSSDNMLNDLEAMALSSKAIDAQFKIFKKTISKQPQQVILLLLI